ncbi:hypothetical protein TUBRATIS_30500 [Tubulinosema ratisbonensis]|uniref:Uncharacterized protein n=1 Tax=Tubulinosema ratisbonensis TaxID=291195 RepID=A0A437AHA5_9MICR|nr:hypothetical protein TUBRATIS_30500 [Tubulinosema ratisbonensis]
MKFTILTMLTYIFSTVVDFDLIRDLELEISTDSILDFYGVINDLKDQDDQIKKDSLPCDYEIKKGDDFERSPFIDERFFRAKKKSRIEEKSLNFKKKGVLEKRTCYQIEKKESHEDVLTRRKSKSSTLAITNKDSSLVLKKPISFSYQNLPNLEKQENLKKLDGGNLEGNQIEVPIRNAAIEPINDKNNLTMETFEEHEVSDLANNFTSEEIDFVKSILQKYKGILYKFNDDKENKISSFINIL